MKKTALQQLENRWTPEQAQELHKIFNEALDPFFKMKTDIMSRVNIKAFIRDDGTVNITSNPTSDQIRQIEYIDSMIDMTVSEFISPDQTFKAGFRPTVERLDAIAEKGNKLLHGSDGDLGESNE